MKKLVIVALSAMALSAVAFAEDHNSTAPAPAAGAEKTAEKTETPAADHAAHGKKMMKKAKAKKAEKAEESKTAPAPGAAQ